MEVEEKEKNADQTSVGEKEEKEGGEMKVGYKKWAPRHLKHIGRAKGGGAGPRTTGTGQGERGEQ